MNELVDVMQSADVVIGIGTRFSMGNPAGEAYETDLHNPDFVRFAESFGAFGMQADGPLDLERLLPLALERRAPVIIDVPAHDVSFAQDRQHARLPKVAWTQSQESLIQP